MRKKKRCVPLQELDNGTLRKDSAKLIRNIFMLILPHISDCFFHLFFHFFLPRKNIGKRFYGSIAPFVDCAYSRKIQCSFYLFL